MSPAPSATVDRDRLAALTAAEEDRFRAAHPRSLALHERAVRSLAGGVPMSWMVKWAGPFPLFVDAASGAHFTAPGSASLAPWFFRQLGQPPAT